MRKMHVIYSVISIILLMLCACSQNQDAEDIGWQGRVEEKDGITEILNPENPVYGSLDLDLEENLVLGNDDDDNSMFFNVNGLNVDDLGNIFVLDTGNHRIQKFDRHGQFLQTIGKEGQGPGEFDRMYSFFIDEEDNTYVAGSRKIHLFNQDGEFVKNINLSLLITNFCITPDNNIFGVAMNSTAEGRIRSLLLLDSEGKEIEKIVEFSDVKTVQRKGKEGQVTSFAVSHRYNPQLILSPSGNDKFFYTYSAEYCLYRINPEGRPDLVIKKEEGYRPISQKERDEVVQGIREQISGRGQTWPEGVIEQACQFPAHSPFFDRLIIDDEGRLYIRRIKSTLDKSASVEYDIFSSDGYYLYKSVLPFSPDAIRKSHMYDISSDEETGEVKIKRYKINNWDDIKKGI